MPNTVKKQNGLSVLISVYHKDEPAWLDKAISSIINQTQKPDEILLVKDGPLTEQLDSIIDNYSQNHPSTFKIVTLETNSGLGPALMSGIKKVSYTIVARMDSDDISEPQRFQKQYQFLTANPDIDLVCSWAGQFEENPDDILFCRKCPIQNDQIASLAKFRNPIDHGTTMFRVSKVLAVGGYFDFNGFEDYHLWVRLLMNNSHIACIPEMLYRFRRTRVMLNRRRGLDYFKRWLTLEKDFLKMGFVSLPIFFVNVTLRTFIYLAPFKALKWLRSLIKL